MSQITAIAAQINAEHSKAVTAAETALNHAFRVGELLTEAKEKIIHGEWLPWITQNLSFGDRQARKYMQLAKERATIQANRNCNSDLGIDAAIRLLSGKGSLLEILTTVQNLLQKVVIHQLDTLSYDSALDLMTKSPERINDLDAMNQNDLAEVIHLSGEIVRLVTEIKMRAEREIGREL